MKLNSYDGFILESIMQEFLLESKLVYMKDFASILDDISTDRHTDDGVNKVAKFLLAINNKNLDIAQNFINIDKESDKVNFIPDNRVKYDDGFVSLIVKPDGIVQNIVGDHGIIDTLKIPRKGLHHPSRDYELPESNKWKLLKTYDGSDADDSFKHYTLFHLQNVGNPDYFVISCDRSYSNGTTIYGYTTYVDESSVRGNIKIGRLINRLLDIYFKDNETLNLSYTPYTRKEFTASDVEKFVNAYSAKILFRSNVKDMFGVVSGEDIRHWYLEDNYSHDIGQLGSSCMRYKRCQEYLNIYVENPDVCKLLILKENNLLLGRALLWIDVDGKKWIDRIYAYKDNYLNLFNNWAKSNGYEDAYDYNGKIIIKLVDKPDYEMYPYMDTFKYFKADDTGAYLFNYSIEKPYYVLQETDGDYANYSR